MSRLNQAKVWLEKGQARFGALSKRGKFLAILAGAALISAVISLLLNLTLLDRSSRTPVRVAVIAPLSGPQQAQGQSLLKGVELFAQQANKLGGLSGHPLQIITFDDMDDPQAAAAAAEKAAASDVIGVIGHASGAAAQAAATVYQAKGLLALTPSSATLGPDAAEPWLFRNTFDETFETRFLANYVRNVVGEKTVSIIHPVGAHDEALADAFDEVLQRFGTKVLFRWAYHNGTPQQDGELDTIAADVRDKKLIGAIFVLGDAEGTAKTLAKLRALGVRNKVVGLRTLATNAFVASLVKEWKGDTSVQSALNGTLVTTPMLFDTSGEQAQGFRNTYVDANRSAPDWLGAYSFDAAHLLAEAYRHMPAADRSAPDVRKRLRDQLAGVNKLDKAFPGLNGPVFFDPRGNSSTPAMVGSYDGTDLVAALTQLSPIREEGVANYLEELIAGRALYVNDRFMYKTSVVNAGVRIEKVSALDPRGSTADLEFIVWFRWRGNIEPQDVVFTNAVAPIKLEKPEKEGKDGDMLYRAYRVKAKFYLNYSSVDRAYGSQLVGVSFRHRLLNRNNLMYVSDVLGMDLASTGTLSDVLRESNLSIGNVGDEAGGSMIKKVMSLLSGGANNGDKLVDSLMRSRVLAGLAGWAIDRAWVSQELVRQGSEGDPLFVGFGKPAPSFSLIDVGVILKPDQIKARDLFPQSSFIFIAIFSFVGAVVARMLDRQDRGQFWRMQTLGLRGVVWPLLLVSVGNLALDYALTNFSTSTIDMVNMIYEVLWWLVPARLLVITLERFVWVPIETRTGRKIPNVIRMFSAMVVYSLALCGVVAFVLGQTLTSLLATSGVMAMIIGLAIQANIANIFSGIVLNIERPFKVGDFVRINQLTGQIMDITWRTVRIMVDGYIVALANGKVSEAEVHNFSTAKGAEAKFSIHLDPKCEPNQILEMMRECLPRVTEFIQPTPGDAPKVLFAGVECIGGHWVGRYDVRFMLKHMGRRKYAIQQMWMALWPKFQAAGIEWRDHPEDSSIAPAIAAEPDKPRRV